MAQQTAVDWLRDELLKTGSGTPAAYSLLFEQANKMFEKQIVNAWDDGHETADVSDNDGTVYYNETYGK